MISEGKHQVRAIEGSLVTKKTGAIGVDVIVETVEGAHAGDRLRWYGHLVNADGTNSEYAQRVIESLRYLGWRTDDLSDLSGLGESNAIAVVEHKTNDQGKTFAEVKWINSLTGGAKIADESRVSGTAAKQLGQRFSALARGVKTPAKPASNSATKRAGAPSFDDVPDFGDDNLPY